MRFDTLPNRSHPIAHRQVKPGESTEVLINLNDPPFTFNYVYDGIEKHLVAPVRFLSPGTYRATVKLALQHPFGPGYHQWTGPATTEAVEFTISQTGVHGLGTPPTKEQVAAYDAAINRVTEKLGPNGFWMNGIVPDLKLPGDAKAEEIVAAAVNTHLPGSKAYRILRVQRLDRPDGMSAALVNVGGKTQVLVFFRQGRDSWWTRFYETEFLPPTTRPGHR